MSSIASISSIGTTKRIFRESPKWNTAISTFTSLDFNCAEINNGFYLLFHNYHKLI